MAKNFLDITKQAFWCTIYVYKLNKFNMQKKWKKKHSIWWIIWEYTHFNGYTSILMDLNFQLFIKYQDVANGILSTTLAAYDSW